MLVRERQVFVPIGVRRVKLKLNRVSVGDRVRVHEFAVLISGPDQYQRDLSGRHGTDEFGIGVRKLFQQEIRVFFQLLLACIPQRDIFQILIVDQIGAPEKEPVPDLSGKEAQALLVLFFLQIGGVNLPAVRQIQREIRRAERLRRGDKLYLWVDRS